VALTATPPPHDRLDVDAGVIEEARARQRRHRGVAAAALVVAAAIAAVVLTFGGGGASLAPNAVHIGRTAQKPSSATLAACVSQRPGGASRRAKARTPLSILSVFRKPATRFPRQAGPKLDLTLYHLARTLSGVDLYVSADGSPQCATSRIFLDARRPGGRDLGGVGGSTAAVVTRWGVLGGASYPTGLSMIDGLVPNGVARVTLYYRTRSPIQMGVVNNVFATAFPRATFPPRMFSQPATEVWRAANGRIIKTIAIV
jgi:hypothetical protein